MKRSIVFFVLAAFLASCGAGDERVDPPAASGSGSGSTTTVAGSPTTVATTSTTTITATTTSTTPTTTAPPRSRAGVAPGEVLVIDEQLSEADRPFRSPDTDVVEAWLVFGTPQEGEPQTSAWLGDATVSRDGRLTLRAAVPTAMATRSTNTEFGTAVAESTRQGDYRLVFASPAGRPTSLTVTVTADAPPLQLPTTRPAAIDVTRQVLGDDNLAGVVFGTSDIEAERSLVARFGPPGATTEWQEGCVGQYRWLRWGPLVVGFRRPETDAAGRFDSYSYQTAARDWPMVADPTMPATVIGLGTAQNITLGSSVADLRGATDDPVEIRTGYSGLVADRWVRRDGEVVAELDRDFLRPDALVVRISAPRSTSLITC